MKLLTKMKVQLTGSDGMPASGTASIVQLPIHLVIPNPNQPRKVFGHDSLRELADSIRQYGVLQPVTVRRKQDGTYELVAGERRLRAAALAGNLKIPAIILDMSDDDSAIVALMENIQRENLSFMEEAFAYRELLEKCFITQDELARRLGKSQGAIANKIRLLKLPFKAVPL
jgi:ParB family chromosome partitioning protein